MDAADESGFREFVHGRSSSQPGRPLVIVAPASAVSAEVRFGSGAPASVPLTEGGGFYRGAGTVTQVLALDRAGRTIATGVPGRGFVGIPLQPR